MLPSVGTKLVAAGVNLGTVYGTTEIGGPTMLPLPKNDSAGGHEWIKFSDRMKIRWEDQGNGSYECQLLVNFILLVEVT